MTAEELAEMKQGSAKAEAIERNRPFSEAEITTMLIKAQVNTIPVDDTAALRMKEYYPDWTANTAYALGYKVQYDGRLYKVIQAHTSQEGWEPIRALSLWAEINEVHTGTLSDPIPYEGSMTLEQGKYYYQNSAIYLCIRDTGNPVYHPLAQMAGLYVEEV